MMGQCLGASGRSLLMAVFVAGLSGCGGGAIYFEAGANSQIAVDENTAGPIWKAEAKVEGALSPPVFTYRLIGVDAEHFSIDANGQVAFLQTADFEYPLDADKNNEYLVVIEASANAKAALQSVRIKVADVSKPQVALIQPKLYANVGKGDEVEVATVVRVFDAESNTPLKSLDVKQNSISLKQDSEDPSLWSGTVVVPEGGVDFPLSAVLASGGAINANAKLFNKRDAVKPSYLAVVPGAYLLYLDAHSGIVGKFFLKNMLWSEYIVNSELKKNNIIFDFDSTNQFVYGVIPQQGRSDELLGMKVSTAFPTLSRAGCLPSSPVNITFDATNKRLLVVLQEQGKGLVQFNVLSFPTHSDGFVDYKLASAVCAAAEQHLVWAIPADVVRGTFKEFHYHRLSKTYIVADERVAKGATFTVIQGFSEAGEKRFEARVGADISNLAINNPAGVIYVAENHSSAGGKIKAIDIATGRVTDLVQDNGGSLVGAYTQLRIDIVNKLLYVADDVGDAFFVVDLATNKMTELMYQSAIVSP